MAKDVTGGRPQGVAPHFAQAALGWKGCIPPPGSVSAGPGARDLPVEFLAQSG